MLSNKLTIKSRPLPLCDCREALNKFKFCYKGNSFAAPTHVRHDRCIFCGYYVRWAPQFVPYCNCDLAFALDKNTNKISNLHMGRKPTETFKHRVNHCKFCGNLVKWRQHKK